MKTNATQQNIPNGWQTIEMSMVADIIMGQSPASSSYNKIGKGLPFFQGKADFTNSHRTITRQWTSEPTKISEPKDLLLSVRAPVGDIAINDVKACIGRGLAAIRAKKEISNQIYLFYMLQSLKTFFNTKAQGSTFTAINGPELKKISILLPPIKEQQKIAEILGTVDEDIAKTQGVIEATEKLKRGLMQQLFTRGIGHTKFKETKIGLIPVEWEVVSIRNSSIKLIDGDRGVNYPKQEDFSPEGFCLFLSAKNVSKNGFIFDEVIFISEEKDKALRKGKLERGDIILTSRGTVGNVAYYDEKIPFDNIRINSGMLMVRHGEQFDPVFLYRYFSSPQMEAKYSSMGSGSAQPQLPVGSLEQVEIPLIPIKEQKEIANIISAVNEKISINKKLKEKLTLLKKGLMQDLLSGKVRVNI